MGRNVSENMAVEEHIRLSIREQAIIRLVSQAKCRKTIADELKLSIHTVDTHLRHIHLKTNTHSLPELLVWALGRTGGPGPANFVCQR